MTRWGQRLLLAGGVLAFLPGLPRAYYTPKSLACAGGLALAWLSLRRARRAPLTLPLLALLAACAISAAQGLDPGQSFWGDANQAYYGLLQLSLYALAYALGASVDDDLVDDGLAALGVAGAVCGALALAQAAGLVPPPWGVVSGRAIGPTGNPVFFGAVAALMLGPALRLGSLKGPRTLIPAAGALALALSRARGAWLAGAAAAAVWLAGSGRLKAGRRVVFAVLAVLAAAALGGALLLGGPNKSVSDIQRVEIWRAAAQAFADRPLLGVGPDNFMLVMRRRMSPRFVAAAHSPGMGDSSAHNDLLQAAATTGALGTLAYLWLWGALAWAVWRGLREGRGERAAAAAAGLAAAFVAAKVNPLPLEACAAAAWLAGAAAPRGERGASWSGPSLAAASLGVLACFAALAAAEDLSVGARAALARGRFQEAVDDGTLAATLTPGRLGSRQAQLQIWAVAAQSLPPERGAPLARRGLALAAQTARAHPGNPLAHEIAGTMAMVVALVAKDTSVLPEGLRELERASTLDPHHPYPVRRRMEIYGQLGDKDAQAREQKRLDELDAATR